MRRLDFMKDGVLGIELFLQHFDFLTHGFLFFIEYFQKVYVLNFILDIGVLTGVGPIFDDDVKIGRIAALVSELDILIILIMSAMRQQHLYNLDQKLTNMIYKLLRFLQMFFQLHATSFNYLVVKSYVALDRVVSHELLRLLQTVQVLLEIIVQPFRVNVGHHVPD